MKDVCYGAMALTLALMLISLSATGKQPNQKPDNKHCDIPVFKGNEVDRLVRILAKPQPDCTNSARQKRESGIVILAAVFCGSGSVTDIKIEQGLSEGLTENAVKAARKIEFIPAEKNASKVSQLLNLEYHFDCQ